MQVIFLHSEFSQTGRYWQWCQLVGGACWTWKPGPVDQYSLGVIFFCYWYFMFSRSKASDASIGIIANVMCL